ncbi:MAG: hypothetical protein ABDH61_05025 [Acidilobaceae archaeon]
MAGLEKMAAGFVGLLIALALSLVASGVEREWEPRELVFSEDKVGRAHELLGLQLNVVYVNVTLLARNVGGSSVVVKVGNASFSLEPASKVKVELRDLTDPMAIRFGEGARELRLELYVRVREGVRPGLSVLSIFVLLLSLLLGAYGLVEYTVLRRA